MIERWLAAKRTSMVAAYMIIRPPAPAVVITITALLAYRLLAERCRRYTLIAVLDHAPSGTVVQLDAGPGGPAMRMTVGEGPRQLPQGG